MDAFSFKFMQLTKTLVLAYQEVLKKEVVRLAYLCQQLTVPLMELRSLKSHDFQKVEDINLLIYVFSIPEFIQLPVNSNFVKGARSALLTFAILYK